MLIVFPLGLLSVAAILDILFLVFGNAAFPTVSFYILAAGVLASLLAAIFGFVDWLALPANSRAKRIGGQHGKGASRAHPVDHVLELAQGISETGRPNIRFHDIRHTVATLLLSKEINPKII